jgi:hypothetical protein
MIATFRSAALLFNAVVAEAEAKENQRAAKLVERPNMKRKDWRTGQKGKTEREKDKEDLIGTLFLSCTRLANGFRHFPLPTDAPVPLR